MNATNGATDMNDGWRADRKESEVDRVQRERVESEEERRKHSEGTWTVRPGSTKTSERTALLYTSKCEYPLAAFTASWPLKGADAANARLIAAAPELLEALETLMSRCPGTRAWAAAYEVAEAAIAKARGTR